MAGCRMKGRALNWDIAMPKANACFAYKTDARSFIDGFENVMLCGAPEVILRNEDELRKYLLAL